MRRSVLVLASLSVAASIAAAGQSPRSTTTPRTPWGDPDLQGTWSSEAELSVPFERAAQYGDRKFLTDEEFTQRQKQAVTQVQSDLSEFEVFTADTRNAGAVGSATSPPPHWLERGKASRRTSLVIDPPDGRIPAAAQGRAGGRGRGAAAAVGTFGGATFNSARDLSLWERCITRGVPGAIFPTVYNANTRIVQGPGVVAITYEMVHDTRIVPLDGRPHVGQAIRGYEGDSRGRWDGDTLVIETTNFREESNFRGSRETLRLVERFRRAGNTLEYEVTVDDAKTWAKPWTAALTLEQQPDDALFEYACHEGNHAMRNILSAARAAER